MSKKITISMSDRPPVSINPKEWPTVAEASGHDGMIRIQANHEWFIRVRKHADGRALVYGRHEAGNGGAHAGWRDRFAGYLVPAAPRNALGSPIRMTSDGTAHDQPADIIRAIRRVAGVLDMPELGDDCIASLPAQDL